MFLLVVVYTLPQQCYMFLIRIQCYMIKNVVYHLAFHEFLLFVIFECHPCHVLQMLNILPMLFIGFN